MCVGFFCDRSRRNMAAVPVLAAGHTKFEVINALIGLGEDRSHMLRIRFTFKTIGPPCKRIPRLWSSSCLNTSSATNNGRMNIYMKPGPSLSASGRVMTKQKLY